MNPPIRAAAILAVFAVLMLVLPWWLSLPLALVFGWMLFVGGAFALLVVLLLIDWILELFGKAR